MKNLLLAVFALIVCYTSNTHAQCTGVSINSLIPSKDSVWFSWPASAVDTYEYAVLPATDPAPASGTRTTDNNTGIGSLLPGKAHNAWLRTSCGDGSFSAWTSQSFSTPCGSPGSIDVTNIGADTAVISWTSVSPSADYQYVVDTSSSAPAGAGTPSDTNVVTVRGLRSVDTYYVYVRTDCGSGVFSAWSPVKSFYSAFAVSIANINSGNIDIKAYPNPVTNTLQVELPEAAGRIDIINISGAVQTTMPVSAMRTTIDMTSMASGIYLLRYTGTLYTKTIRIHKQ